MVDVDMVGLRVVIHGVESEDVFEARVDGLARVAELVEEEECFSRSRRDGRDDGIVVRHHFSVRNADRVKVGAPPRDHGVEVHQDREPEHRVAGLVHHSPVHMRLEERSRSVPVKPDHWRKVGQTVGHPIPHPRTDRVRQTRIFQHPPLVVPDVGPQLDRTGIGLSSHSRSSGVDFCRLKIRSCRLHQRGRLGVRKNIFNHTPSLAPTDARKRDGGGGGGGRGGEESSKTGVASVEGESRQ